MAIVNPRLRQLYNKQDGLCIFCGRPCELDWKPDIKAKATKEHILPRHKGGSDHMANLVMSCHDCNRRRGPNVSFYKLSEHVLAKLNPLKAQLVRDTIMPLTPWRRA